MNMLILAVVFAYVTIPDTPQIDDRFLGVENTNKVIVSHKYIGLTHQDSIITTNADSNLYGQFPFTMQLHVKSLYGDMWRRQAKRALVERCERLIENVNGIVSLCDYDARNLICRPPDCPFESYDNWSSRNQRLWYIEREMVKKSEIPDYYHRDNSYFFIYNRALDCYAICRWIVSIKTKMFNTNRGWYAKDSGLTYYFFIDKTDENMQGALDFLLDTKQRINPSYHDKIKNNFRTRHSFAIPLYGSYIFDDNAVFEEFSHQINVGVLKTEWRMIYDTVVEEFPEDYRNITKWSEFVVGIAGAKQDAFETYGIDIGQRGGFADYFQRVQGDIYSAVEDLRRGDDYIRNITNENTLSKRVAHCTIRLLLSYQWAKSAVDAMTVLGQEIPSGITRFISWCESDAVGRMVL